MPLAQTPSTTIPTLRPVLRYHLSYDFVRNEKKNNWKQQYVWNTLRKKCEKCICTLHIHAWNIEKDTYSYNQMANLNVKIASFVAIHATWASCQIRKIAGAHARGMPGTFSPSPQVSDPDMHHGTCVTHVPWCMPGSLTSGFLWNRRWGKTFPAFPAHAQPAILRIW